MQRSKTAIVVFDRVTFCPPAGHLTSSYEVIVILGIFDNCPVQRRPKFSIEAQDLQLQTEFGKLKIVPPPVASRTVIWARGATKQIIRKLALHHKRVGVLRPIGNRKVANTIASATYGDHWPGRQIVP
jgi:hypothetical protein